VYAASVREKVGWRKIDFKLVWNVGNQHSFLSFYTDMKFIMRITISKYIEEFGSYRN